jgi:ARG/rhodanese/phosphatase superfamily protein
MPVFPRTKEKPMPAFPEVRIGDPVGHEALTAFPLFAETCNGVDYLLADEAIAGGTITVEEVGESGSVPDLLVDSRADRLVLFLEGEELRGAKQNRVLNTSVLIEPASKTKIPVSCVEHGRWCYNSRHFGSGGSHASSKLRHVLKRSVYASVQAGQGHSSNQGEVWKEVGRQMASLGSHSATGAMADTYLAHDSRLTEFKDRLNYVEGATGLAVAVAGKVVSVDVFDKPGTCRKVWERLLTGVVLDALEAGPAIGKPERDGVQELLTALREASWQPSPSVGAGEEFRAEAGAERHASALTCNGTLVHGSLVAAG